MRGTLLSRALPSDTIRARSPSPSLTPQQQHIPTIRLISATPSAAGSASDANNSLASTSFASSYVAVSSPLSPKPEDEPIRKKLVPKKSKLGILGSSSGKVKERGKDLSDIVRRAGGASSSKGGFEIYVDPTNDPDLGEIVMVKKKKSRVALSTMQWGNTLEEVTNVQPAPKSATLKPKGEDKDKWWSIGRGRKDSKDGRKATKENGKENIGKENGKASVPPRTKTREPLKTDFNSSSRSRFNSLDSRTMLNTPSEYAFRSISSAQTLTVPDLISDDPTTDPGTPDEVHTPTLLSPNPATGSIALRAMRSMRSLAHIGSWSQVKPGEGVAAAPIKKKEKEQSEPKKKKKKEKQPKEGRKATIRQCSGSSFEAGHPSPSPMATTFQEAGQAPSRKSSVLGLGLPSTMRFGTARALSVSTNGAPPPAPNRLSAGSSVNMGKLSTGSSINLGIVGRGRSASTLSTASSLRPPSTASGNSRTSSTSATSVKWDEQGLETVKEQRKLEREVGQPRETRRASDGRRRAALADIFPDQLSRPTSQVSASSASSTSMKFPGNPIVTIEEATADGHGENDEVMSYETPNKRRRARPVSEQVLARDRPAAMCDDVDGALSILDAATNELASLISRLDLEATPGTPDRTPLRLSPSLTNLLANSPRVGSKANGSPVRKLPPTAASTRGPSGLRTSTASVTSLRPYAQSRSTATASDPKAPATWSRLGKQIAPWPISPTKPATERTASVPAPSAPVFRMTHKRTLSPAPAEEPPLVFRPLQPAKSKQSTLSQSTSSRSSSQKLSTPPMAIGSNPAPSSVTFGSRPSKIAKLSLESNKGDERSPTPVFRRAEGPHPPPSLWLETKGSMTSVLSDGLRSPITAEARKGLGLAGTLGGSVGSVEEDRCIESDDPDSDIPNELQAILLHGDNDRFEDTMSFNPIHMARPPPSPGSPPGMPLPTPDISEAMSEMPVFRAQLFDDEDNLADIDSSDEDTTKKSFDFTGELKALNESGASDRRSFVEQLETAFRTPAKYDLDGFGQFSCIADAPPVPPLPKFPSNVSLAPTSDSLLNTSSEAYNSLLPSPEISIPRKERGPESLYEISLPQSVSTSSLSKPSTGELNVNFRFGGRSPVESSFSEKKPLTLSDIIPPPSHARSISMSSMVEEDSSLLKSIMDKATDDVPPARPRLDSDASSKRWARDQMTISTHSRASSMASFSGFDSFNEVRRGFEFSDNRPAFYPPPAATARQRNHNVRESVFSIASVSSYGVVLNPGVKDPFDYGTYDLPARPSSDDFSMSMSMSVDDTFDFIHRDSRRKRVDSDASSFYFRAPGQPMMRPLSKVADHRRRDSAMSTNSFAPPVSLYNRSFGIHRRNDSSSSAGSVAQAYAMHGGPAARMSWMRHRADASMDSVLSDMSAMQLGRPGLGDKMLDSAPMLSGRPGLGDKMLDSVHDYGMPLTSISASPPESLRSERFAADRTSFDYDSIIDATNRRFSIMEDSIFEKTGRRTSVSSESLFGGDESYEMPRSRFPGQQRYRPVSIYTIDSSEESPKREDDTMVTMLDGGHVRRRSVGSVMDGSPCVRIGKRKHGAIRGPQHRVAGSDGEMELGSPNKARLVDVAESRLITQPSIASTSSRIFGDERMIRAQHGLLQRQSLEESCLTADGEDLSGIFSGPVFTRPGRATRSRSSTYSSTSSGVDTPPLSMCDSSQSSSGESQSSIDLSQLSFALVNMTHPMASRPHPRSRQRGQGHRRRISQARASRSSVYETIQEEMSSANNSPVARRFLPQGAPLSPVVDDVMVVDSDCSSLDWENEGGVVALRKYYALRDEAHVTVEDSKRAWTDTPFSLFAVQSFDPPEHPVGMRALLEHSQQTYGPLPSDLRPRRIRSRTSSRASPYPQTQPRLIKVSISPATARPSPVRPEFMLQERTVNQNVATEGEVSPYVPAKEKDNQGKMSNGLPARPRVGSNARRTALGWAKRSAGRENKENRENVSFGTGSATPGESLRINRPRPRGRPTPRAGPTPIRI
ncbi:hypothetical protein OF83DRAFT_1179371 [Amylostereum chailletii]|nr:hypothetical protein OF83DRAFT_1179371 [Amylostereum chailletii]